MSETDAVVVKIGSWKDGSPPFSAAYRGRWYYCGRPMEEDRDRLPCPKCGSTELATNANVVECHNCGHNGPFQEGPEYLCDWRDAIVDWNNDPLRKLPEPWNLAKLEPLPNPPIPHQENT
jgi:predicted RNA-binding Zn-ribbon protein involved in translation (DUF1610 family)